MTRRGMLRITAMVAGGFAGLFAAVALIAPHPRLLWNASPSAPIGLYWLRPDQDPQMGALVAIHPPATLGRFMAKRRYLPLGVPLLKHVAAQAGSRVCRWGTQISIDGQTVAAALLVDSHGRPLPVWRGCRDIEPGQLFLLNPSMDSLDSRYLGLIPASGLIGRAMPILTRDAPNAPLRWHIGCTEIAFFISMQGEGPCR